MACKQTFSNSVCLALQTLAGVLFTLTKAINRLEKQVKRNAGGEDYGPGALANTPSLHGALHVFLTQWTLLLDSLPASPAYRSSVVPVISQLSCITHLGAARTLLSHAASVRHSRKREALSQA